MGLPASRASAPCHTERGLRLTVLAAGGERFDCLQVWLLYLLVGIEAMRYTLPIITLDTESHHRPLFMRIFVQQKTQSHFATAYRR